MSPSLTIDAGIAHLTLRRPSKLNRLNRADLQLVQTHCAQLRQEHKVRVLVLRAETLGQAQPVFSAGFDVNDFDPQAQDNSFFEQTVDALAALPQVTIAAVNGSVYGGATDLVLACDLRVGLADAVFRMPACALGLHYYPHGLQRFVRVLGPDLSKQLFLSAQAISFQRLYDLGVFMQLCTADALNEEVQRLAQQVADLAPLATSLCKQSLNEIAAGDFDYLTLQARERMSVLGAEFAAGKQAFAARRLANFPASRPAS